MEDRGICDPVGLEAIALNRTLPQVFKQLTVTPNEEGSLQGQCQRPGPIHQQVDESAGLLKQDASWEWEECRFESHCNSRKRC